MKCPICGKDLELRKKQIGTNENGDPIFNEYAICRDCKKQWNLDKQRAKKMAAKKAAAKQGEKPAAASAAKPAAKPAEKPAAKPAEKPAAKPTAKPTDKPAVKTAEKPAAKPTAKPAEKPAAKTAEKPAAKPAAKTAEKPAAKPAEKPAAKPAAKPAEKPAAKTAAKPAAKTAAKKAAPADTDTPAHKKTTKKKTASEQHEASEDEKRYGNIPSQKQRTKSEKAVRKGYEEMLSTDPDHKPSKKKKAETDPRTSRKVPEPPVEETDEYEDDYYDDVPRFRAARIILAVISLAGFAFFAYRGFTTGLSSVSAGDDSNAGMVYIILAVCMLVSALLYLILQKKNTIFAFLLPMIVYLGSAAYAFLMRGSDIQLLISAIASAVLALISLILAITSRGGYDEYDDDEDEDYEDPFEDDYADE